MRASGRRDPAASSMGARRLRAWLAALALAAAPVAIAACGGGAPEAPPDTGEPADELPPAQLEAELPEGVRAILAAPFVGDFNQMVERRLIRIAVTFNRTFYFIDKGVQRGAAYEYGKLFEGELNKKLGTGPLKVHVLFVPLPSALQLTALTEGRVDAVVGQLTVTPERQALVDFTNPTRENVSEVVVTGLGAPAIASVADLAGREVFVRGGSSYQRSLEALNERFEAEGKPPVVVRATANLEDDDLLEMADAGLIPITVVDLYLAEFWSKVLTGLTVHDTVAVRTGGNLAVAIRKNSPELAAALNEFIARNGLGTAFGNMMEKRYLVSTKFVKNAASEAERKKLDAVVGLFRKYSEQYDMDYLLMGAQAYQESGLNHEVKSAAGAVGIMQVMPATGKELNVGDITQLEPNIHAGVKYMRFMIDRYFKDEPMDRLNKGLFAFASYNAGPGRVRQLRREAAKRGLDANVWFGNVEQIASERIGRETVTYVSNIYKYYVAYQLVVAEQERREAAKAAVKGPGTK